MNKKILSIFALIMAISILGVSCSENPADPNNGGSGNPNLPTAQYPQTDLTKAQVAEIVKKLGTVKVNAAEADKTVEFALGSEAMDTDPILGAYAADGVAMAATSTAEPTKATVIGINDVLNAFNAVIKSAEYQKAVKDIKDTDDKSLITKVNDATVHFADGVEIVLAITFVDSENKNGVIALPLTITSGAVSGVPVDFGATTAEMPAVTEEDLQNAIINTFSEVQIVSGESIKTLAANDVVVTKGVANTTIEITTGIADPTADASDLQKVLDNSGSGTTKLYDTLVKELRDTAHVNLTSPYASAGITKLSSAQTKLEIASAASSAPLAIARIPGSGYYYTKATDGLIVDNKLLIRLVAGGNWGA